MIEDEMKSLLIKTLEGMNVDQIKRFVQDLSKERYAHLIHENSERFHVMNLDDFEPKIRCADQKINTWIKKYKPKNEQENLHTSLYYRDGAVVFFIFVSKIVSKRIKCAKVFDCRLDVYECEISVMDMQIHFPYN